MKLTKFSKHKASELLIGKNAQLHNGKEAVHVRIVKIDPKNTGKFYGEITSFFVHSCEHTKGEHILCHADNISHFLPVWKQ